MTRKCHVRCEWGEKIEITSKSYLSIWHFSIFLFLLFSLVSVSDSQSLSMEKLLEQMALENKNKEEIVHRKEFSKIKEMGQTGVLQLVSIARQKKYPASSRIIALQLLEHLGNSENMTEFLSFILDKKESHSFRQQILQTAITLNTPGTIPFILSIIQGKESLDIPLGQAIRNLRIPERSIFLTKLSGEIFALLQDKNPSVRQRAASVFVAWQNPKAGALLLELCKDPQPEVRATAIWALANQKNQNYSEALMKALQDPSSLVRERSLASLSYPANISKIPFQQVLNIQQKEISLLRSLLQKEKELKAQIISHKVVPGSNEEKQWQRWNLENRELQKLLGEQRILLTTLISLLNHFLYQKETLNILLSYLLEEDPVLSAQAGIALSSPAVKGNKETLQKIFSHTIHSISQSKNSKKQLELCSFLERLSGKKIGNSPELWIQWWERENRLK